MIVHNMNIDKASCIENVSADILIDAFLAIPACWS